MRIAIMQPYFLPYLGYFQLMNHVDKFVIYDNIEYTKKGYINRNKIIDGHITIPLRKAPDKNFISQREIAPEWICMRDKIMRRIQGNYHEAPCYAFIDTLARILYCNEVNLFYFIENSLREMKNYLGITTPLVISSTLDIDHSLRKEHKVNAICEALGATHYVNPIGGKALYTQDMITAKLSFLRMKPLDREDTPNGYLSIADICFRTNDNLLGEFTLEK